LSARTKENIEDPQGERTKETSKPSARTSRSRGGGLSVDPAVTRLRRNGASDISITHIPSNRNVTFPAFLTSFSDGTAASFGGETYYGRMDPSPVYQNTTRSITVSFDVVSYSELEARHNLVQINNLQAFTYPEYESVGGGPAFTGGGGGATTIKSPPLLRVKFANLISDAVTGGGLLCYTNQVSFDPDLDKGVFEATSTIIGFDGNDIAAGDIIPKSYTVTLTLNVLHEHSLGWQGSNFNDGNLKVGDFPRKFNTPAPQSPAAPPATQGVEAGTPAATGPNDDGVATSQAGTEEQREMQANSITGGN